MRNKKAAKVKAARGIRNLPAKTLTAKQARGVKGGISMAFAKVNVEYKPQKAD